MKAQKWYYLCNIRSAYFHINKTLHRETERESKTERDRDRERAREREREREM